MRYNRRVTDRVSSTNYFMIDLTDIIIKLGEFNI